MSDALPSSLGRWKSAESRARSLAGLRGHRWACGKRWWGRIKVPDHHHPLVKWFFKTLNDQKTPMVVAAERSGIHPDTIRSWRYCMPGIANFAAALNALGYELVIRKQRTD